MGEQQEQSTRRDQGKAIHGSQHDHVHYAVWTEEECSEYTGGLLLAD